MGRLRALKERRGADAALRARHAKALADLGQAALDGANVMPALIEASEALATVGEMMDTLQGVYGRYDGGPEL